MARELAAFLRGSMRLKAASIELLDARGLPGISDGRLLFVRGSSDQLLSATSLPARGTVDLLLSGARGEALRQPWFRYRVVERTLRRFDRPAGAPRRDWLGEARRQTSMPSPDVSS